MQLPRTSSPPARMNASDASLSHAPPPIPGFDEVRWSALQGVHHDHPWHALPDHVHRTSMGRPWQGLAVWHQVGPLGDLYVPAQSYCAIWLRRAGASHMVQRIDQQLGRTHVQPGDAVIVPSNQPSFWRSTTVRDNIHLGLAPAWLQRAAGTDISMPPCFGRRDPVLMAFAELLLASLDNNVSLQPEFAEHMAMAIALHLVENYAAPSKRRHTVSTLTSRQMRQLSDNVLAGLHENWSVARMAEIAGLSPFHFSRAFKVSFGTSPHSWVHLQRMEQAAQLVRASDQPFVDIALACGHPSAAHFSHAFRRHWGVTPTDYRRAG